VLSLVLAMAIVGFMVNATGLAQAATRTHNFALTVAGDLRKPSVAQR
jgi:hypothetical protein